MSFHDVLFPTELSEGYEGGPGFKTIVIETDGGAEERVSRWANARWTYRVHRDLGSSANIGLFRDFFLARGGALHSFRLRDHIEFSSDPVGNNPAAITPLDQAIGVGNATETLFQLRKQYTSGSETYVRDITLPVVGTVRVAVNGIEKAIGSDFTVNLTTGVVTFMVAPPDGHAVTAGFQFDVAVRFGVEADEKLPLRIDTFDVQSLLQIPLVEVKSETPYYEGRDPGGHSTVDPMTADETIARSTGFLIRRNPNAGGLSLYLVAPSAQDGTGGPYHLIQNLSGSNSVTVRDDAGGSIGTIAAGTIKHVYLTLTGTTYTWVLL